MPSKNKSTQKITIGIPIYNEEVIIPILIERLLSVKKELSSRYTIDILIIDDGSTDRSFSLLKEIALTHKTIKVIKFSRNFGLESAINCIINNFAGDALVVIDGDLQDPPEFIPEMVKKWEEGYDVVYTIKRSREESLLKRFAIFLFYKLQSLIVNITIPIQSGNFSLLDNKVVCVISKLKESNKYFPGLRAWCGFNQIGLDYDRDKRYAGKPKMNFLKLLNLAMDGIFSYTKLPQRLTYIIGILFIIIGLAYIVYAVVSKYFLGIGPIGWASTIMTIYLIGGFQIFVIGLLGEYIVRIFDESRKRPDYLIYEQINFKKDTK